MSPEQSKGDPLDKRSDLYSFGCLMYETLSGVKPFHGDSAVALMDLHLNVRPPAFSTSVPQLKIPRALELVVMKAMEKAPVDRYQTAQELGAAVEQAGTSVSPVVLLQLETQHCVHQIRMLLSSRRNRIILASTLAIAVIGVPLAVLVLRHHPVMYTFRAAGSEDPAIRSKPNRNGTSPDQFDPALIAGDWDSDWGPVHFTCDRPNSAGICAVGGHWIETGHRAVIEHGEYRWKIRSLHFTYYEDWLDQRGEAYFQLDSDGRTLRGTWTQPSGHGPWVVMRPNAVRNASTMDLQNALESGDYVAASKICSNDAAVTRSFAALSPTANIVDQLLKLSDTLVTLGKVDEAKFPVQQAVAIADKLGGTALEMKVKGESLLCRILAKSGDVSGAQSQVQQTLQQVDALGDQNQNLIESLCNLGIACEYAQDFQRAVSLYDRARQIASKTALDSDPVFIRIAMLKARALSRLGKNDDAESTLKDAEVAAMKGQTSDVPQRSLLLSQLGAVAERGGKDERALAYYERAIKEQSKVTTVYPQFADMLARYAALLRRQYYGQEAGSIESQVQAMNAAMGRKSDPESL
jgi:tetratricopeptide (TPR) repeat protein